MGRAFNKFKKLRDFLPPPWLKESLRIMATKEGNGDASALAAKQQLAESTRPEPQGEDIFVQENICTEHLSKIANTHLSSPKKLPRNLFPGFNRMNSKLLW